MTTLPDTPTANILYEMLADTHPKMVDALHLAAISPWYDVPFFTAVRAQDDGKSEALIPRLTRYSFVSPLNQDEANPLYGIRADERELLQRHWIAEDPDAYRNAHQRAYDYRHAHPDPANPDAHSQNELFHLFFADFEAGITRLIDNFRLYFTERRLTAIDRLLQTADQARIYLHLLDQPNLYRLDILLTHLRSRTGQLRGHWRESLSPLRGLLENPDLPHDLAPYVIRSYGLALAQTGQYVEAIDQLKFALDEFKQRTAVAENPRLLEAEQGYTMIALGDAYISLAVQARGYEQRVSVLSFGRFQILTHAFNFFLSLPLVFYLTIYLGYRVWLPQFWPVYRDLDWLIARLFATAANYYKTADPLLENHNSNTGELDYIPAQEAVAADEKLAFLYLRLGAHHQAKELFDYLLSETEAPLGEYRRATVRVGHGQALVQLNDPQAARIELEQAMPMLEFYEEASLLAEARTILAQAMLGCRETVTNADEKAAIIPAAIYHLGEAMQAQKEQGDWVKATEVSEYLLSIARDDNNGLTADQKAEALQTANKLSKRHYPIPYRHPVTTLFRRLVPVVLAIVVFFIMPMSTIELNIDTNTMPQISFGATPLLDPNNADFTPDLMQSVTALNLAEPPNPNVLTILGIELLLGYLLLSTSVGLLAMVLTPLRLVQEAGEAAVIRLDEQSIRIGRGWTQRVVRWNEASQYLRADVRMLSGWLPDSSYSVLKSADEQITIGGSTAWYASLSDRIAAQLPTTAEQTQMSHAIVRSRMGVLCILSNLLLLSISLLGRFAPPVIPNDFIGSYSLADIYPYVYLGSFVPMAWWFIVLPLRKRWRVEPTSTPYRLAGASGLLLGILRLRTQFRPWLTVPDIYPSLAILLLIVAAGYIIVQAKKDNGERERPLWLRLFTILVGGLIAAFLVAQIWQATLSYHYLAVGSSLRDQALRQTDPTQKEQLSQESVQAYARSVSYAETKLLGLMATYAPVQHPFGLPKPNEFTWLLAKNGKAAMETQLGNFQTAVDDYTALIQYTDELAQANASRAIAYQGLAASMTPNTIAEAETEGTFNPQEDATIKAIANYNTAIELAPNNGDFYLWRGVAYHSLGNIEQAEMDYTEALRLYKNDENANTIGQSQALLGLGWIEYSRGNYDVPQNDEADDALKYFKDAHEIAPNSVDAALGLGYAHYSLRQYDEALAVWQTAVTQDENNPILYISLGTLYWRVGTLGKNYNALSGSDRCSQAFLPDEAKTRSADLLTQSIENLEKSIPLPNQTDAERAFTYRTIAQVQYLLRNCPEHDKAAVLQDAVASYQKAAELDATNPLYWHMQGRLSYAVWQALPPDTGPSAREWLFRGLSANEVAISLNDVDTGDYKPNAWENALMQAIGTTLTRGDDRFANGEYEVALQYYELMTTNQPDNAEAAFKAALAQLALGDTVGAEASLQRGRELAQDQPELIELYQKKWTVYKLFQEALTATAEGEEREAAALYDEAIQKAAAAELLDVVQAGASDLRDYLLANEDVRVTAVYWPLEYTTPSRDLSALDQRDLFWRYRAEFGYKLTQGLFNALPGREAEYAAIFNSVTSDIQRAAELESKAHATRAEFFTNSNIGWLYLRRGDTYFADGDYVRALSDYDEALRLISPDSETSLADLTEATFKAALTAVATNDYQRAAAWYDQATQQATRLDDQNIVRAAANALGQFLLDNPNINPLNVYWPLQVGDPVWSRTTVRNLYWRYRAEFGFRLISALFNNTPGQEATHETIFASVIVDIERAYALDSEAHRDQRNFLVDTNMGWFYLQRGSDRFKAENYAEALVDFQEAIGRFRTDSGVAISYLMNANLQAGLAALLLGDLDQSAVYYNQGLELAAQIEAFDSVLAAANALATALQENPNIDQTAAFWPLQDDRGARETAVSQLRNPDLYWRYRAEFGFRLISRLFAASSGSEEAYETMFAEVIADIEAAYTLNPEDHQVKRDFFVDANIGWFYLQRGNEHRANGRYAQALADYEQAVERMRPDSINARNDLLDAMFNAGLSALSLNNFAEAQEWYRRGISLASEYEETGALNRAGKELELLLFGRSLDG